MSRSKKGKMRGGPAVASPQTAQVAPVLPALPATGAVPKLDPSLSLLHQIDAMADHIAANWYTAPSVAAVGEYEGVSLGDTAELTVVMLTIEWLLARYGALPAGLRWYQPQAHGEAREPADDSGRTLNARAPEPGEPL